MTASCGGWRGPVGASRRRRRPRSRLDDRLARRAPRAAGHAAGLAARRGARDQRRRGAARLAGAPAGSPGAGASRETGALCCPISAGRGRSATAGSARAPRRMADVVQPGDLVMIEPPRRAARPAAAAARRRRRRPATGCTLRQIPQVQGALVSLDPTTGRVLAMVGRLELRAEPVQPRDPGAAASRRSASSRSSI